MDFAQRFRQLRVNAGLTGTALASPRYTVSYISQIEAGRRRPSPEALKYFAEKLGVSANYLSTGIPDGIEATLRYQLEEARRHIREGDGQAGEGISRRLLAEAETHGLKALEAQALIAKGDSLGLQGRVREAIDAIEDALATEDLPEREMGSAVASLARNYRSAGDLTYAAELIESFLSKRRGSPLEAAVATELHSVLVSVYFERGDVMRAERAAARALAAADENTPSEVRALAYWNASRVLAETKRWDEALDMATRARVLMEEVDDLRQVARLHNAYAFICLEAEPPQVEQAREHLDIAEKMLADTSATRDLAYVFGERGRLALIEGRPEEALADAERTLASAGSEELESTRALFTKGRALGMLGRTAEAKDALYEAAFRFEKHGARQQQAACWREVGELDLAAGDVTAAVDALRAGLEALDPRRSRA